MPSFFDSLKDFLEQVLPAWAKGPMGAAWFRAQADATDSVLDATKDGIKARFPSLASNDELAAIGGERQLPRGPSESQAAYAERIRTAWTQWTKAGTDTGVLQALWDVGYQTPQLVSQQGLVSYLNGSRDAITRLVVSPRTFVPNLWSTFCVYFPSWSGTPPAQTSDEAQLIIGAVLRWKAQWATLDRVIIQQSGPVWGFPVTAKWGGSGRKWGGGTPAVVWTIRA